MGRLQQTISFETIADLAHRRKIFIWGAGNQGRGIGQELLDRKIPVAGFIDRSTALTGKILLGLEVFTPDIVTTKGFAQTNFIIVASYFGEDDIFSTCTSLGMVVESDFISFDRLKPYDYAIDVSGACNLACISCPRAEGPGRERRPGYMTIDNFQNVINKIRRESPLVRNIQLYQWGEPTLNKHLPEMIRYTRTQGIKPAISSNLNISTDYRAIIEAQPEWLRISASGSEESYHITHTKGQWSLFRDNLVTVSQLRRELYPEMRVELYYHVYKQTRWKDIIRFRDQCSELNIEFIPVYAYLISLDDVLAYAEGNPLPPKAQEASEMLVVELDRGLALAKEQSLRPCNTFRIIHINWDLSVSTCMMYYYPQNNIIADNYLTISDETIIQRKQDSELCRRCLTHGVHRYCNIYNNLRSEGDIDLQKLI